MKKLCPGFFVLLALCVAPLAAQAQTQTAVTATVTDPSGIPYANGTFSIQLIPTGNNPSVGGAAINGAFNGALDATGSFSASLWPNASITPGGTTWQFTICSNPGGIAPPLGTGTQCTPPTAITISGTAQVLSTTLSNLAPSLTHFAGGGAIGTVTNVTCGNLVNVFNCAIATPSTTPAFSFTPITSGPVLDCSQQTGADMGAKLNACIAALPASGGIADATKFSSPQTISTAVVNNKAAVIQTCGIAITQTANISLTATRAAWHGCPDQSTVITKGANIDQFTLSANYNALDFVTLAGVSASFTGNGVVTNNASLAYVANNRISDEASDGISVTGTSFFGLVTANDLSGYVLHAIQTTGTTFEFWITHNKMDDTATATGNTVELASVVFLTENDVSNSHGFLAVHNTQSSTNASVYSGNYLQSIGTGGQVISVAGQDYIHHNTMFNTGAHALVIGGASITDNNLQQTAAGADVIDAPSSLRPIITGNNVAMTVSGTAGFCGINLNSATGWEGGSIEHNTIGFGGTGSGANYGVCLTTQAGQFADDMVVQNNDCISSTGAGVGSACVFFNNAANVATNASSNVIRTNQCIGINNCIARTDSQNNQNYYENNASGLGTTLFTAGGSTNDVIIQQIGVNGAGITFANLPTAGNGSQIYCSDCTPTKVVSGSSTGALVVRTNGAWVGGGGITLQVTGADVTCGTGGTLTPCTAFTTITGLTRALPLVAATWTFTCDLIVSQATAAAADQIGVQTATNAPTNLAASGTAYTAAAVSTAAAFTGVSSTTAQSIVTFTPGATGTKLPIHIAGTIEGASASGTTFNLQVLTGSAADLLTVYRGSSCQLN